MTTHQLKTWPVFFGPVAEGIKTFELRRADRKFAVGDLLHLREWLPFEQDYTGEEVTVKVTYILGRAKLLTPVHGLGVGFVIMAIQKI